MDEYFGSENNPSRENLRFFIELRNKIEHRFIPALDINLAGYCQSLLMNLEELIIHEFGEYFTLGQNLALAIQFSAFSSQQQKINQGIQRENYEYIKEFIDRYELYLSEDITNDIRYCFKVFLIPKTGNHKKSSDICMEFIPFDASKPEEMKEIEKQIVAIKIREVPIANLGMLKPKKIVEIIQSRLEIKFNLYIHTQAWKIYNIRPLTQKPEGCNTKYCHFSEPHKDFIYTKEWVEFLCKKLIDPDEYQQIVSYRPEKQ